VKIYTFHTELNKKLFEEYFFPSAKKYGEVVAIKGNQGQSNGIYRQEGWLELMSQKIDAIIKAIKENNGQIFMFCDADAQFFNKIEISGMEKYDMLFQRDNPSGTLCAGVFFCKGNGRTLEFWQEVKKLMGKKISERIQDDQDAVNFILRKNKLQQFIKNNKFKIKWGYLPAEFYGAGTLTGKLWTSEEYLPVPENIILHHANYTQGLENKIGQMEYLKKHVFKNMLPVPKIFQPAPPKYTGCVQMCLENYFYDFWEKSSSETEMIYLPVFWTSYYFANGYIRHNTLQKFVKKNINPNKKYFTIVENADGIIEDIPKNILVFASGKGNIPVPLLKALPYEAKNYERDIFCSFMGKTSGPNDKTGVRSKMISALPKEYFYGNGNLEKFIEITKRSVFTLCPRGYGRTSFRLYEALALGSIPVYIWDDVEWLPYKNELDWDEFAISINIKDIDKLPNVLKSHTPEMLLAKQKKIKEICEEYFSFDGTCRQIIKFLSQNT
jgi:hypothetical protein